jgi:hypothetical protein
VGLEEDYKLLVIFLQASEAPEDFIKLTFPYNPVYVRVKLQVFVINAGKFYALKRIESHP